MENVYNSTNLNVYSIPKKNWGKCFVNRIWDFRPHHFRTTGTHKQVLSLHNPSGQYDDFNEKLLDE